MSVNVECRNPNDEGTMKSEGRIVLGCRSLVLLVASMILITVSGRLSAQVSESSEPLTVVEESRNPTEEPEPAPIPLEQIGNQLAEDLPELAGRIVTGMRNAEVRLANGKLDEETSQLQEQINADLARLLATLEQQASQPAPVPGEDAPPQTSGQDPAATGGTGAPGANSTEGESAEGDRPGELTDADLARRRNLATSVWGHLPEKERDEMLGAFSERFLPAYDELVRRYYESLAARKKSGE